jgi:hypothetical protein
MTVGYVGRKGEIEIEKKVVREQARQTVRQLVDAVVELSTNCDDSYRRMKKTGGHIAITVGVQKGGIWNELTVRDGAGGMGIEYLIDEALKYGARSSGFEKGLMVRGLWGRGLKETLISFGSGIIKTIKDGYISVVRVWWDEESSSAKWEVLNYESIEAGNGTVVTIQPDENIASRCPDFKSLYEQLSTHYALREIVQNRDVWLQVNTHRSKKGGGGQLKFENPTGIEVVNKIMEDTPFGPAHIKIYESPVPLSFNRWDPCSLAGIIVRTGEIPLDNSLFSGEEHTGKYFFGEVNCTKLVNMIKKDPNILTTSRTGINWRQSECREFETIMKRIVEPLLDKKRTELITESAPRINKVHKERLLKMLNQLAGEELEVTSDEEGTGNESWLNNVSKIILKPEEGSAKPGETRRFSVYVPSELLKNGEKVEVELVECFGEVILSASEVELSKHPKREELCWGHFEVKGNAQGDSTWVKVRLNEEEDLAYFEVKEVKDNEKKKQQKKSISQRTGGFFKDIRASSEQNPQQRVAFLGGVIYWFTEFPVVRDYLIENKLNESQGKVLFAEMISEAVCAAIATKRMADGLIPGRPNESAEATVGRYTAEVNRIRRRCLGLVHRWARSYNIETEDFAK